LKNKKLNQLYSQCTIPNTSS